MRPNVALRLGDRGLDLGAARDVHLQRQRAAPERADRVRRAAVGARVAVAERDVGARLRQRDRARAPQAPRRAGHQRDLVANVEAGRVGWLHDGKNDTTRGVSDSNLGAALDELAARFAAAAIPATEWTHETHLTMGAWHVARFGPDAALERLRAGIRALNAAHGTIDSDTRGYHETITRAYVRLLAAFLRARPRRRGAGGQRRGVAREPARRARRPDPSLLEGAAVLGRGAPRLGRARSRAAALAQRAALRSATHFAVGVARHRARALGRVGLALDVGAGAGLAGAAGAVARVVAADAVLAEAGRALAWRRRTARRSPWARPSADRTRPRRCRSCRPCTRRRDSSPARRAGRCRRCWAGCTSGTGRGRRSRSRRRRRRSSTSTARRRRRPRRSARLHAPEASQLNASMPPPPTSFGPPSSDAAVGAPRRRASSAPPSPRVVRAGTAALVRVRDRRAVVDRDRGRRRRRRRRASSASSRSANVPRAARRNRERRRRRRAPRRRGRARARAARPGAAPGWISTVPRWVALSGTSAPARGHARVVPQRAGVVVDGDAQLVGRRHAPTRRTGRASPRPTRAAWSCRNPLPRRATPRPERAAASSVMGEGGRMRPVSDEAWRASRHGLSWCRPSRARPP